MADLENPSPSPIPAVLSLEPKELSLIGINNIDVYISHMRVMFSSSKRLFQYCLVMIIVPSDLAHCTVHLRV